MMQYSIVTSAAGTGRRVIAFTPSRGFKTASSKRGPDWWNQKQQRRQSKEGVVGYVAPQFQILQTGAVTKGVVGEVENMIGFMINNADFEKMQVVIDGIGEAQMFDHLLHSAEAAVTKAMTAFAQFVTNVAWGELRPTSLGPLVVVETAINAALAVAPDPA